MSLHLDRHETPFVRLRLAPSVPSSKSASPIPVATADELIGPAVGPGRGLVPRPGYNRAASAATNGAGPGRSRRPPATRGQPRSPFDHELPQPRCQPRIALLSAAGIDLEAPLHTARARQPHQSPTTALGTRHSPLVNPRTDRLATRTAGMTSPAAHRRSLQNLESARGTQWPARSFLTAQSARPGKYQGIDRFAQSAQPTGLIGLVLAAAETR